ncbi:hypothetical protein AVEN_237852-1, partial [Araneus ventricosus]
EAPGYDKHDGRATQKSTSSRTSSRVWPITGSIRGPRKMPESQAHRKLPDDNSPFLSDCPVPILTYQLTKILYFSPRRHQDLTSG